MQNVIHVTHEAIYKVGGIGTVLEGLINSRPYRDGVGRTVLVCPLFYPENPERLGPGGVIEYSSLDQIYGGIHAAGFGAIERDFNVRLVYGLKPVEDAPSARRTMCEVLLVDLRGINTQRVNDLKSTLWQHFGIQSHRYEHAWEFEQYVQLAAPASAALEVLRFGNDEQPAVVFAHEFMGVPTALALQAWYPQRYRTLFYAHEVAPIRRIVEEHPGHDLMFYRALDLAAESDLYLEQVFGPQDDYFKLALVQATHFCDGILAVGHHVVRELQFLSPQFRSADISLTYNGAPVSQVSYEARKAGRARVQGYLEGLLGWRPTRIFTHVTRLAPSKALWRDLDVLAAMEAGLAARGETAVLVVLSTELPRRPLEDILHMEREWDWPLAHREGPPDLTGGEARFYQWVQSFNARSRQVHVLYINQFGFSRATCGTRVSEDIDFLDMRRASDLEFGLSLYEPFGISPVEPLTYGALCAISTSCGCAGFVNQASGGRRAPNVILADYLDRRHQADTLRGALQLDALQRRRIEQTIARDVANQILESLPVDESAERRLLSSGLELARRMSWDVVAERFVFPAIRQATARRRTLTLQAARA